MNEYIAHVNEITGKIQTVKEHSENTAKLCSDYAIPEWKNYLYNVGLLHDIGKYLENFQLRIKGKNIRVEHSICGAIEIKKIYKNPLLGIMAAYVIAGHHAGIPDGGYPNDASDESKSTLQGRLKRQVQPYDGYKELITKEVDENRIINSFASDCKTPEQLIDIFSFFTRYCFSCLTDADSKDTASFCSETIEKTTLTGNFKRCLEKINQKLESFVNVTELQKARSILQEQAFLKSKDDAEIYLLNMPTGSGKTLTSAKIALERALKGNKKRIIYIIPYNSISDQIVAELEKIFGSDMDILRHQSTYSFEDLDDKDEDYRNAAKIAVENWDAPFIVTTTVQFFESIYSNKRGKLRKLHNMADSILIFDEAHLMPKEYFQSCLQAITYIAHYLNSEAIFLTATMPNFYDLIEKYALKDSKINNLIQDKNEFAKFKKCKFNYIGDLSPEEIVKKGRETPSSLIIMNQKKAARKVYELTCGKKYHLSTYMTAVDRARILEEIREELKLLETDYPDLKDVPIERRITIVSTSLIEAGVDIDVHTVFRELTGLDSILQAGGRCNREGKRNLADVYVFDLDDEERRFSVSQISNLTKGLFKTYDDVSDLDCIEEYYKRVFEIYKGEIEMKTIHKQCSQISSIPFKRYASQFELIDDRNMSLVIPNDEESQKLVNQLKYTKTTNIRKLQKYTCSLAPWEMEDLLKQHAVDDFETGVYCLENLDYYNENTGIEFQAKDYFL